MLGLTSTPGYLCVMTVFLVFFKSTKHFGKSLHRMTSLVVLSLYKIKFNMSTSKTLTKIPLKKVVLRFKQSNKKIVEENFVL